MQICDNKLNQALQQQLGVQAFGSCERSLNMTALLCTPLQAYELQDIQHGQHRRCAWLVGQHTSKGVPSGKPALLFSRGNRSCSFQCSLAKQLPRKLRDSFTGSYSFKKSRNSSLSKGRMGLPSGAISRYSRSSDWFSGRANPLGCSYSQRVDGALILHSRRPEWLEKKHTELHWDLRPYGNGRSCTASVDTETVAQASQAQVPHGSWSSALLPKQADSMHATHSTAQYGKTGHQSLMNY